MSSNAGAFSLEKVGTGMSNRGFRIIYDLPSNFLMVGFAFIFLVGKHSIRPIIVFVHYRKNGGQLKKLFAIKYFSMVVNFLP